MDELHFGLIFGLVIKIYALLTPTAVLSSFIAHTHNISRGEKFRIAFKTGIAIYITGQILYLFGARIFAIFGFTLDAFRIGVGVLLFLSAIDLMNDDVELPKAKPDTDISIVPLAIPLGMGPSAIGAVMVMGASAATPKSMLIGSICIFLASMGITALLCLADTAQKILRRTGILIMAKLTALIVSALAAQAIFSGIKAFLRQVQ